MNDNIVKIRLKTNDIEIECEGRESFLLSDLSQLLERMAQFVGRPNAAQVGLRSSPGATTEDPAQNLAGATDTPSESITTETIASRLAAKKEPDLVMAALARLVFFCQQRTASRDEILQEMKAAPHHYKKSFHRNLNPALARLVKAGRLNGTGSDTYALTASEKDKMEALLREKQLL